MKRNWIVPSPSEEGGETPDEGMSPAEEYPRQGGLYSHGLARQTLQSNKKTRHCLHEPGIKQHYC